MAYSSGCHFDFEMTTGWNSSGSHTSNRKILLFVVDNA